MARARARADRPRIFWWREMDELGALCGHEMCRGVCGVGAPNVGACLALYCVLRRQWGSTQARGRAQDAKTKKERSLPGSA